MNALLLVDLQNDFTPAAGDSPAGALAVPDGNAVTPLANALAEHFDLVVATQDWHPPDHLSFVSQHPGHNVGDVIDLEGLKQMIWPDHCVRETAGARFLPDLNIAAVNHVVRKGLERHIDSYSGFYDNGHRRATGLGDYLRKQKVRTVYVLGLALDVCVKFTALDARRLGFEVCVVRDGCRGVELRPGDGERAVKQMREAGVRLVESGEVPGG